MTTASRRWDRWSVRCELVVADPADDGALEAAGAVCDAVMGEVELAVSSFRVDSEVTRLRPGWNDVSPLMASITAAALGAARESSGAVDPTVGRAVAAWRSGHAVDEHRAGRWADVELRGTRLRLPSDVLLDFGATGKAYAADLAATRAARTVGTGVLVNLGGDIATDGTGPSGGWQVCVRDTDDDPTTTITLRDGWAVTTSSTEHRRADATDPLTHHLLDPSTGRPALSPWRTATVVALTAVAANTASTAAVVRGGGAVAWLSVRGQAARLVARDGRVVVVAGFPRDAEGAAA